MVSEGNIFYFLAVPHSHVRSWWGTFHSRRFCSLIIFWTLWTQSIITLFPCHSIPFSHLDVCVCDPYDPVQCFLSWFLMRHCREPRPPPAAGRPWGAPGPRVWSTPPWCVPCAVSFLLLSAGAPSPLSNVPLAMTRPGKTSECVSSEETGCHAQSSPDVWLSLLQCWDRSVLSQSQSLKQRAGWL